MKLIREYVENVQCITESVGGVRKYYIEGPYMTSETKNRNGRVYPKNVLDEAVYNYGKNYIEQNRALGELGHNSVPTIQFDRVSHLIKSLSKTDTKGVVHGKAEVLDTPMGKIAKNLIDAGVLLGVSSRGLGAVNTQNGVYYVKDFTINTVDIVHDPSGTLPDGSHCFVQGIYENADWVLRNGEWIEVAADVLKHRINESVAYEKMQQFFKQIARK